MIVTAPMNARPDDPSTILYAPASTCVLADFDDGEPEERSSYGYGLIYVTENTFFYNPLNFLTQGQRLSFVLKYVTSVSYSGEECTERYLWFGNMPVLQLSV